MNIYHGSEQVQLSILGMLLSEKKSHSIQQFNVNMIKKYILLRIIILYSHPLFCKHTSTLLDRLLEDLDKPPASHDNSKQKVLIKNKDRAENFKI